MGKNLNRYYRGRWVAGRLKGLGGFAASLKIELAMTMRATVMDRLSEGFGGSAGLRLLAGAVVLAVAMPAAAGGHPTRIVAKTHRVVQTPEVSVPSKSVPKAGKGKAKNPTRKSKGQVPKPEVRPGTKPNAKPAPKAKHHKLRPDEEADGDPLVIYRAKGKSTPVRGRAGSRAVAVLRPVVKPKREVRPDVRPEAKPELAVVKKTVLPEVATRPAQSAVETFERGESHPEDDERMPMHHVDAGALNDDVAVVAPVTKPMPWKRGAKEPIMPQDEAGREAVVEAALTPQVLPTIYTRNGKLIVPPPMKGTREILVHQNTMADSEGPGSHTGRCGFEPHACEAFAGAAGGECEPVGES